MNNKKKKKDLPLYALTSKTTSYFKPGKHTSTTLKQGFKRRMYDPVSRTHQLFEAKKNSCVKKDS